jgi:hypothetical protein
MKAVNLSVGRRKKEGKIAESTIKNRWTSRIKLKLEKLYLDRLRVYSRTCRPLGTDKFISKIEVMLGHRLRPLPVGRPKKKTESKKEKDRRKGKRNNK